ncbi:MAG TPA: UDP-N-acetylmuramoyl-L-alanine--D-glutamate ligase [Actinomycetota bacterium]|nr:UDP-N-acetylmuramoyl-L-alanine--D-glutamate ligase [Actinomycetota bacterium]
MSYFAGKRTLVVGLGDSGYAAASALVDLEAKVRVTDSSDDVARRSRAEQLRARGAEVELGGHDLEAVDADLAILSPGVPLHAPIVAALRAAGVEVMGELELAYRLARAEVVAVTGTNGKTTTTTLLTRMLVEGGRSAVAAGNIGVPAVDAAVTAPADGVLVLEVSSFQLATIQTFRAHVAVLLNLAEDHTDWHETFDAYRAAKARIVENQGSSDVFVFNAEDDAAGAIADHAPGRLVPFSIRSTPDTGIGLSDDSVLWRGRVVARRQDIALPGTAGLEDSLAAAAAALEYGIEPDAVVRALRDFRPLPHRLETVAEIDGVAYIDDSKATNPHATLTAVAGFEDVVLIAGGRAKGMDLSVLSAAVPPVRAVVAIGEAKSAVEEVFSDLVPVEIATTMDDAVTRAHRLAGGRGSVLLSPGCASLDMYDNYAQRGEEFARAVKRLTGSTTRRSGETE